MVYSHKDCSIRFAKQVLLADYQSSTREGAELIARGAGKTYVLVLRSSFACSVDSVLISTKPPLPASLQPRRSFLWPLIRLELANYHLSVATNRLITCDDHR